MKSTATGTIQVAGKMAESMSSFAATPEPPYFAVIFTSRRTPEDGGYNETADRMAELAQGMPGYLGIETARGPDGLASRSPIGE